MIQDDITISIIIWAHNTNMVFFRDCLESVARQEYRNFELLILDENRGGRVSGLADELFPHDGRLAYHRLKSKKGLSYALNVGLHRRTGSFVFFMGQHDRLSDNALSMFAKEIHSYPDVDVIYSDRDELIGVHRMHPAFLPDLDVELLRHTNYIGDNVLFSINAIRQIGTLKEELESAAVYELLLGAVEKRCFVRHIPRLLYHVRVYGDMVATPQIANVMAQVYREHVTVAKAHIRKMGIRGEVKTDKLGEYWRIHYDGSNAASHRSEYALVHEKGVSVRNNHFVERMYGILQQKDVGIVGVRFEKSGFRIDNCGYIFDEKGIAYPACHNQSALSKSYMNRAILPHDVSMVDPALFMIDTEVLRRAGGFDKRLTGRALMLDLCFKVRAIGRRVVFDPGVVARKKKSVKDDNTSSKDSNELLAETWERELERGDPYYNRNLPMGLQNYLLY